MSIYGHYDKPFCGGLMSKSGKGGGPRTGAGQRHQQVYVWPSWSTKTGSDVYLSSRWDDGYQIFDLYWTHKSVSDWWQTKTWEWIFLQEIPYDTAKNEFVWSQCKIQTMSAKQLRKKAWRQRQRTLRHQRRR